MKQHIALFSIVVKDYDEAIQFYTQKLGFLLLEDTPLSETKRWVVVAPQHTAAPRCGILLAKASDEKQMQSIGNQTGGRVGFFLYTDDFWRDYHQYQANGVQFVREPLQQNYGIVAVFSDLYGNLWDLLEPKL
jgi:predicted enzyme related to lactoylglutathione lyase